MVKDNKNNTKRIFLLSFTLIALFFFFSLVVPTRSDLYAEEDILCIWKDVDKIVAIGDLHGDYDNFVKILKKTELVDDELHWTGGKTHLVQTGDVLDRGRSAKDIFNLIIKLENEAEAAGGKVHMLLGNHEEMNIVGIAWDGPGYVKVDQFTSFLTDEFKTKKEKRVIEKFKKKNPDYDGNDGALEAEIQKFWQNFMTTQRGRAEQEYFVGFNKLYGDWLLKHNIVIQINNILFSHGGMSEKYSAWKIKDINNAFREEVVKQRDAWWPNVQAPKAEMVRDPDGPLWYRELALNSEEEMNDIVDAIFKNLSKNHGIEHIVIAHTPQLEKIKNRFDERIWLIDTGISYVYGGHPTALIIEKGEFIPLEIKDEK